MVIWPYIYTYSLYKSDHKPLFSLIKKIFILILCGYVQYDNNYYYIVLLNSTTTSK